MGLPDTPLGQGRRFALLFGLSAILAAQFIVQQGARACVYNSRCQELSPFFVPTLRIALLARPLARAVALESKSRASAFDKAMTRLPMNAALMLDICLFPAP